MTEIIKTYCQIPLKNIAGEILDYAIVSKEDYCNVIKYKWWLIINKKYKRVSGKVADNRIQLSHFIFGKPEKNNVIDHINNNSLDNRRENLQSITKAQNAQNKKKVIKENTTSIYKGVAYETKNEKWATRYSKKFLGYYTTEIEAAEVYDRYVLVLFGKNAATNGLVKYESVLDLKLENLKKINAVRELPLNIYFRTDINKYFAKIHYKKKYLSPICDTIEKAVEYLNIFKKEIDLIKKNNIIIHNLKEIRRDNNGFAVLNIYNINKEIKTQTIVDDCKWHELELLTTAMDGDYVVVYINGNRKRLHRFLMNAQDDEVVDHNNNNELDNRLCNLRICTDVQNGYNKKKCIKENTTSIYKGVRKIKDNKKNPYLIRITKNGKALCLGNYNNELKAAIAYNLKAKEIFGEFANLNKFEIDLETYILYEKEVIEKLEKINKKKINKK